jgi:hypothetical protein
VFWAKIARYGLDPEPRDLDGLIGGVRPPPLWTREQKGRTSK